jgi:hypothetical protein
MKRLSFAVLFFVALFSPSFRGFGQVVISEFMADNTRTIYDEDGDSSDWIEIHNVSDSAVNLLDWSLTDKAGNLTRWRFPATNINAAAYMVVFASGKDRRTPGRPLHTSFSLDPDGEYLALVKPDGATIATEFAPFFPQQVPNVSFGFGLVSSNSTLLAAGAPARVLVPTTGNGGSALGDAWKGGGEPFDDSAWISATTGIGFSSGSSTALVGVANMVLRFNFDSAPVANVVIDSKPVGTPHNGTAAAGTPWVSSSIDNSPTPISRNGVTQFVVPLNSQPTNQITVPANADFNSAQGTIAFWMRSSGASGPGTGPAVLFDRQTVSAPPNSIANGGVIVQNLDGTLSLLAETNGVSAVATTSFGSTADDRWHHVAVTYDQTSGGSTRIYIDGVLDVTGSNARAWFWPANQQLELGRSHTATYRRYNGYLDDFRIYNRTLTLAEVSQIYSGDGGVDSGDIASNIEGSMLGVNASAFIRVPFNVANTGAFSLLTLRIKYNDGFAAWLNGQLIASDGVADPLNVAYDAAATTTHSSALAESIPVGNPARFLRQGQNILAIQGLNISASDGSFLVLPELIGSSTVGETANPVFLVQPTPGGPNVGGTATVGPLITEVGHTPNVPLSFEDLVVTARAEAAFASVSNLTLFYKIMYNAEVGVPMNDGGTNGDKVAGDGLWSGMIPASAFPKNGQMIRYYVTARDLAGTISRWPLFNNPTNSEQYLGTIVNPTNLTSKLPIFHVFFPPAQSNAAGVETGTRCSFFYDGEFYDNVRIELRGNTSASFDKKAYRLEFNRDHKLRHPGPGGRIADTSLLGEWADPGYFRQAFSFWLLDAFGTPSPFDYPVRLQLNGDFFMLCLHNDVMGEEQLSRLGYDPHGALYKAAGQVIHSEASTGVFEKRTRLYEDHSDYYQLTDSIVETNPARTTNVFDLVDIPQVINYLVCARWTTEADDVWANMTLYRDSEGDRLWRIIPFDMNVSWGQLYCGDSPGNFNMIIATNDNYKSHPLYGGGTVVPTTGGANWNRMYDVIIRTPATREMFLRRMRTLMDTIIQPPDAHPLSLIMEHKLTEFTNAIWTEAFLDRQKWSFPTCSGARGPYCWGCTNWLTNHIADCVNQYFVPRRKHWFVTHSITNTAKPIGINNANNAGIPLPQPTNAVITVTAVEYNPASTNQLEEYICITNGNPYAVDISGWKLGGGVEFTFIPGTVMGSNTVMYVSPDTLAFRNRSVAPHGGMALLAVGPYKGQLSARGEPLTITDNRGRLVYTNTYAGNPSLAQQFLRVTELMYNPSPLPGNPTDPQEFEYIELKNISASSTISLNGVRFINGILFDFTGSSVTSLGPGQRVLVVKNLAAFTARYGAANVAGQYTGGFDNAGERVQLVDGSNEEILDFTYNNSWYRITDGLGFSLVVVDENQEPDLWDQKIGWRPSASPIGAPGQNDPPPPAIAPILVNEVFTHTDPPLVDAVELLNPTASAVNIGGWFISDDFGTPKKYRIANNTMIPAGGYLMFDETQFNTPSNAPTSFSFSSKGDEVFIFSGDANTNLTGYYHGYDFGAAENGVTFGRYTNSQTNVHFVAQSARTISPPGPNAGPKVGPVVISEIMYHPPDRADGSDNSEDEYIELQNITGSPVPLFLGTNTWHLRGGTDFDLPANITLPANGTLLLVHFDTSNAALVADFRSRFGVPANVPLYGPFSGKLDNSSDTVKLQKPDAPELLEVPYILVEEIEYRDEAPWPVLADGTGAALQRRVLNAYGNDPTNWTAVAATAGSPSPGGTPPVITVQPAGINAIATLNAMLSVTATGSSPLGYQWKFNGQTIPGATSPVLSLVNVQIEDAGQYSVAVYNTAGAIESTNATVNVLLPSVITQQPRSAQIYVAPDPKAVPVPTTNFSVTAVSSSTIRYQWRFNGNDLPGATNATLVITNVQVSNGGDYSVSITDDVGTIYSVPATLYPLVSPKIVLPPLNQTVAVNSTVTLGVTASGSPFPMGYEWRRGSFPVASNAVNSFANFYTFTARSFPTSETYRVIVRNLADLGITANAQITVAVVADSDNDGIPDFYEAAYGSGGQLDPNADNDGDHMTNLEEYIAGTDPNDPSSYLKVDSINAGTEATLRFNAASNRTYSVQFTDSLGSGIWQRLTDVVGQTNAHMEVITDRNYTTNRFYRLATPEQP